MFMTFRWYGPEDTVPLAHIAQIPGVEGVVSALHHLPAGEVWTREAVQRRGEEIAAAGLRFSVVESIPVHEDIKLGRPERDRWIEHYCRSLENVGGLGIPVVCYNFMPLFDWTRTSVAHPLADGSTTMAFDGSALDQIGPEGLPQAVRDWMPPGDPSRHRVLLEAYRELGEDRLWEALAHFLNTVVPVAESSGVRMAIHPDDPPWSIFGLPRIITDAEALTRVVQIVDSPSNGVTFCTGSLGARSDNDLPAMIRSLGDRIHFVHLRNVLRTAADQFHESPHPSRFGSVDFLEVLTALSELGFSGPARPDHGRMIWGEEGRPGYGLYDRALGAVYLQGLWEAIKGHSTRGLR